MKARHRITLGMIAGASVLLSGIASADARTEWRQKAAAKMQARKAQAQLQQWDTNKNGFLEAGEINAAKQKYGERLDLARLSSGDVNRDGILSLREAENSKAFSWTSTTTKTNARGTATVNADGTAWKTANGKAWEVDRNGTNFRGKNWQSHTTGEGQRTDTGRTWNSTTTGSVLEGNRSWETDRNGELIRNADGTVTVVSDFEKTLNNGNSISGEKEKTITKTEDGRSWEAEGSRTNQEGDTTNFESNGTATRTGDGIVREGERTATFPNGSTRNSKIDGVIKRDGNHTEKIKNSEKSGRLSVANSASAKDRIAQAKASAGTKAKSAGSSRTAKSNAGKSKSGKSAKPSRSKGGKK